MQRLVERALRRTLQRKLRAGLPEDQAKAVTRFLHDDDAFEKLLEKVSQETPQILGEDEEFRLSLLLTWLSDNWLRVLQIIATVISIVLILDSRDGGASTAPTFS
jgi:hypothetical protein